MPHSNTNQIKNKTYTHCEYNLLKVKQRPGSWFRVEKYLEVLIQPKGGQVKNRDERQAIRKLVGAPECVEPWLERFYGPKEVQLLLHLRNGPAANTEVFSALGLEQEELDRAWQRGIIARNEDGTVSAADFSTRFDYWAMFEGWQDIPGDIKDSLNRWEFEQYCRRHEADLETVRRGEKQDPQHLIPRYLLLEESLEVIDRVERVYLWPCNCRMMLQNCSKPVYTCLRFSNDRGIGWEISKYRAKKIIQEANRAGLMQSGEFGSTPEGRVTGAICNCCADCCFPHLMAKEYQAEKIWPRSRYRARQHQELCTGCGRCVRRCPFQALRINGSEKGRKSPPDFNPDLCRGCGVCATGCPEQAMEMVSIEALTETTAFRNSPVNASS